MIRTLLNSRALVIIALSTEGCVPERSLCLQELMEYGFVLNENTLCADRADNKGPNDVPVLFLYDEDDLESSLDESEAHQLSPSAEAEIYFLEKNGDHLELSRDETKTRLLCTDADSITENLYLLGGESIVMVPPDSDEGNLICVY